MLHRHESSSTTTGSKAGPHIAIAHSLPPAVSGEIRGELVVCVERLAWNYRKPPQQVQIRLRWWGAAADTVVPFHAARGAGAAFPLTSGPRYLSRYLKDMGSMLIAVEECPSNRTVGQISVDISTLDVCKPIEASVPLKGSNGQLLATADVSMRVHYSALLSSFELNEHLASADKQLPLYPVPSIQQQAAEAAPAAHPAAPDKENTTALPSCTEAATRTSDTDKPDQQQATTATSLIIKADQQQQLQSSDAEQHALVPAAAAGEPTEDGLLDIVRKAEQLKQAMDQAAQRGICLALPQAGCLLGGSRGGQVNVAASAAAAGGGLSMLQLLGFASSQRTGERTVFQQHQQQLCSVQDLPVCGSTATISPQRFARAAVAWPGLLASDHSLSSAIRALPWSAAAGPVPVGHSTGQHGHQLSSAAAAVLQLHLAPASGFAGSADGPEDSRSSCTTSSCCGSHISELEDLEEIEDLLLQELFSSTRTAAGSADSSPVRSSLHEQQQQQQAALQVGEGASAAAGGAVHAQQAVGVEEQQQPQHVKQPPATRISGSGNSSGPQLQVELAGLQVMIPASTNMSCAVTAVIKSAGRTCCSLDVTALLQRQQQQQTSSGSCHCPCSVVVAGPPCLLGPLLATDKPCLAIELWCSSHSNNNGKTAAPAVSSATTAAAEELLGIVRVPLQQQAAAASGSGTTQLDQPCFASGTFPVYDVLRGKHSGNLELRVLLAEVQPTAEADVKLADAVTASSAEQTAILPRDPADAAAVVAVRHVFDVTVHTASHLPDVLQLLDGSQRVPEGRFMKYSFPGEEPLYTQEVDVVSSPTFSAHAQHTVVLPVGESLADCFASGDDAAEQDTLQFEVFNKWEDDSDSLIASGSLPLQQILQLSQVDHPATSQATACMRTFLVPLQLTQLSGEAAVQQPETAVLLQVTISYSAENCYSMQAVESDVEPAGEAAGPVVDPSEAPSPTAAAVIAAADALAHAEQTTAAAEAEGLMCQRANGSPSAEVHCHSNSLQPEQHAYASSDSNSSEVVEVAAGELRSEHRTSATGGTVLAAEPMSAVAAAEEEYVQLPVQQADSPPREDSAAAAAAAATCTGRPQAPQYLSAELCVEVVRACGLQAAVQDAAHCLPGGSGLLGRAQQLGPHPYATVNLPFCGSTYSDGVGLHQALKTPFQAQTFCPQFSHRQVVPITLDPATLSAIAAADCTVELWHHCPRSQAVAAALSRGQTSSYVMAGQQQVLLGSATCQLQALLTRPQGIKNWLVLESQLGRPVGAVQVALQFTHIGGAQHDTCPAAPSPLSRHPELLPLLPDNFMRSVGSLVAAAPEGFQGQLARMAVHVEELLLPGGDDTLLERPKIAKYTVSYRLPGSQADCRTHSKASSSQQSTSLLARSWHVDWQFCGAHWVIADWRLSRALHAYPLQLTVTKQEPSRRSSTGSTATKPGGSTSGTTDEAVDLPVGFVEVDLTALLLSRPDGLRPNCRWLSGTFAVIHPMCKNLGNIRLKVKVLLDLQPAAPPPKHLLADPVACWQITGALAAMPTSQPHATGATAVAATTKMPAAAATGTAGTVAVEAVMNSPTRPQAAAAGRSDKREAEDAMTSTTAATAVAEKACRALSTAAAAVAAPAGGENEVSNVGVSTTEGGLQSTTSQQQSSAELAPAIASLTEATALDIAGSAGPNGIMPCSQPSTITQQQSSTEVAAAAVAVFNAAETADSDGATQSMQQVVAEVAPAADSAAATSASDAAGVIAKLSAAGAELAAQALDDVDGVRPIAGRRSRLRAEVSYVSAPASTRSSSPETATGAQQYCQQQRPHSAKGNAAADLQQRHQQQQEPGQDGSLVSLQEQQQIALLQPLVALSPQQQQHRWTDQPGRSYHRQLQLRQPGSMQDVRVCLEGVLNLRLPTTEKGWEPCLYVSYDWKAAGDVITTPLVPVSCAPLSQTARAQWFHSVYLPLAVQHQLQHSSGQCGGERTAGEQSEMQLQVWLRCLPAAYAAALPPLYAGIAAAPADEDQLLGCATLDMSALHVLGSIEGWYNICDAEGEPQGQLKVSLTPLKQAPASLRAVSHPGAYSTCSAEANPAQPAMWVLPATPSKCAAGTAMHDCSASKLADATPHAAETGSGLPAPPEAGADASAAGPLDDGDDGPGADAWLEARAFDEVLAVHSSSAPVTDDAGDSDALLATLQANLQELDAISASLAKRVTKPARLDLRQASQGQRTLALPSSQVHISSRKAPAAAAAPDSSSMQQQPDPSTEAAVARAYSFRHVQTLSDDEDYMVAVGGVSESDTDTEELMGQVDWSLAQNSDEECYPGPPPGPPRTTSAVQQTGCNAAAAEVTAPPAATTAATALLRPLNTDEWMFDISRPAAAAAAGASSTRPAGPVNPAQLSQSDAAAATAAAAARLAEAEAARAAAAIARAAAQERNREREADEAAATAAASEQSAAAAAAEQDVWRQLAELEDAEDRVRPQQQLQPPAAAAEMHDPRQLPEQLEKRLDQLLANFQAAASGPPPGAGQRPAAAAVPQPGGSSNATASAAAASRVLGFADDDWDDDNLADDAVDYSRHEHVGNTVGGRVAFANCLPPVQDDFVLEFSDGPRRPPATARQPQLAAAAAAAAGAPECATSSATAAVASGRVLGYDARWENDGDAGDDLVHYSRHEVHVSSSGAGGVAFANCLPPVQDDFVLEYSDAPRRVAAHVQHTAAAAAAEQLQSPGVTAVAGVQARPVAVSPKKELEELGSGGNSSSSTSQWQHPAAAGVSVTAVTAASTSAAAPDSRTAHMSSSSSRVSGFVPVIGDYNAAMMDDMFSFSKRSSSSSSRAPSHPAVTVNPAAAAAQLPAPSTERHLLPAASNCSSRPAAAASTSTAFVPVLGQYSEAGLDNMFSFKKNNSSGSSGGNTIKHPGM